MKKVFAAAIFCAELVSCASTGTKVDTAQIEQFQKGVTTYPEVVAALGDPTNVTTAADGKRVAVYSYAQTRLRPESFVPYYGLVAGGADVKTTAVVFRFDAVEKLVDYSSSVGNAGAGYGLEAK